MNFRELIDSTKLQKLQDEFSLMTGLYIYCLDNDKNKITKMSGEQSKVENIYRYIGSRQICDLLERVEEGSLEDVVIEELEDGTGTVAVISVKVDGQVALYWVVIEAEAQKNENAEHLNYALDLLRDTYTFFLHNKMNCYSAEVKSQKDQNEKLEMSQNMEDIEATTEIVQLLDSDEPIEAIMEKWLGIMGGHLKCDAGYVFGLYTKENYMDVVSEWRAGGVIPFFDKSSHVETLSFLNTDKPVVISKDNMDAIKSGEMLTIGIQSVMVFPLLAQENVSNRMVLSLFYRVPRTFSMKEIKFVSDAVKLMQSILTKRIQKNSLAASYAALEAVLDNVGSSIYVMDKESEEILFVNRLCKTTFQDSLQNGVFRENMANAGKNAKEGQHFEYYYTPLKKWYDISFKEISWVDGRRTLLYALYDITDKKIYQKKIEQQAFTDFLTGLYNRMCCERDLARAIDDAKNNNAMGAILYMDLDDFKHINDSLGHQYGDVLLKGIAHEMVRVEGIQDTCYRMGGDEFVILIRRDAYDRFDKIIAEIKEIFSKPWFLKNSDYYCTMSMGIVTFPDNGDSVPELIKKADIAMYEAKKSGKNRVAYYSDTLDSTSGRRLDMEKNMRDATGEGCSEFEIYYQPIMDVSSDQVECVGAEALLRWNSSKLGFVSPMEFVPLAEYLGLINPIGNYVLQEACYRCKKWNENGYPNYKVNVNLSVVQLLQPDIVEIVEKILKDSKLNPKNLTLEVTESLAINDMERMKKILDSIKKLGVKIALDDFGTGYSSLNHIREILFDIIKVDQSFVKELAEDAYSQSFVKMVSELAQTIGVKICVEGIETQNQYKVLQGMKVKYIQGYYFDKPMPSFNFEVKYCPNISNL